MAQLRQFVSCSAWFMTEAQLAGYLAKHRKPNQGDADIARMLPAFKRGIVHPTRTRQRKESNLVKQLLKRASELGMKLWRNQVGTYKLADGRYISSGLCVGSSDLIGYLPVVVTPEMVGKTVAVFVAIEAKAPTGKVRPAQEKFLSAVSSAGGIHAVAFSPADLEGAIYRRVLR